MKILLCILILSLAAFFGISYKWKLKQELGLLLYLKDFATYLLSNITLFKNNLSNIIDDYIIMQKNKNAKYNKIFMKNDNYYLISENLLQKWVLSKSDYGVIFSFLKSVGGNDYDFEKKRIEDFISFLNLTISKESELIKTKADLKFKLCLAVGAIICIVLW